MTNYYPIVSAEVPLPNELLVATCISAWQLPNWKELPKRFLVTSVYNLAKGSIHRHVFAEIGAVGSTILHFTICFEGNEGNFPDQEPNDISSFPGKFCTLPGRMRDCLWDYPNGHLWKRKGWYKIGKRGWRAQIFDRVEDIPTREEHFKKILEMMKKDSDEK